MSKMAVWWKRLIIAGLLLSIAGIFLIVAPKEEKDYADFWNVCRKPVGCAG